jgi:uncharacterized membrane protein YfcA
MLMMMKIILLLLLIIIIAEQIKSAGYSHFNHKTSAAVQIVTNVLSVIGIKSGVRRVLKLTENYLKYMIFIITDRLLLYSEIN